MLSDTQTRLNHLINTHKQNEPVMEDKVRASLTELDEYLADIKQTADGYAQELHRSVQAIKN